MISFRSPYVLLAATLLAACATTPTKPTSEALVGHTLRVEAEGAPPILLRFNADRTVLATVGPQQAVGNWSVANAQICLSFPKQAQDCWPFAAPFVLGRTTALTSSGGSNARVTLVE